MTTFQKITLEFIRPGPQHNQLLSPLTPYMALCGEGQPVTLYIPIEHHKLLNRLRRLRYVIKDEGKGIAVADPMREAEVIDLGEDVASILGEIKTLNSEIARAQGRELNNVLGENGALVHLRLVLSGSELSLIPFELATAPQAFPGEGLEFCLQDDMPVVITREIRRNRPNPIPWDQPIEPRILFISAEPLTMTVPKKAHVHALRQAIDPWIRWPSNDDGNNTSRTELVKERLRLLINPCIDEIYDECAKGQYTHIHILAHGISYDQAGEQRFGLALCQKSDKNQLEIISGKELAKALQAEFKYSPGRSQPLVVTLATCDSGNTGSLLIPGGSIAYDLHAEGIPWVFASQFPLTKRGSVKMTETLYPKLLGGTDPRQVLYEVRRQLFMTSNSDHDWASMVAFVSMPENTAVFQKQVINFFEIQMRRAIEICFDRVDYAQNDDTDTVKITLENIKKLLKIWERRLPAGKLMDDRTRRAECYGLHGSVYKRIALLLIEGKETNERTEARKNFSNSLRFYKRAMDEMVVDNAKYYWVATQYLCLTAVTGNNDLDRDTYRFVKKLVKEDLDKLALNDKAWVHGTMAELEFLSLFYDDTSESDGQLLELAKSSVLNHCKRLIELKGVESFHASSTARQFQRYIKYWLDDKTAWKEIAEAATKELTQNAEVTSREFPQYVA